MSHEGSFCTNTNAVYIYCGVTSVCAFMTSPSIYLQWVYISVCKLYLNILTSKNYLEIAVKFLCQTLPSSDIIDSGQGSPSDAVENQLPHFTNETGGRGEKLGDYSHIAKR